MILCEESAYFDAPASRNHVQNILAEEQEVVGKRNDGEEIVGEGICNQIVDNHKQIEYGKNPGFNGNDKKQKEPGIGEHGGIAEKKTQIQIGYICPSTENHTPDVHHQDTAQIEQVEPECAPDALYGAAKGIVTEQCHSHEEQIAVIKGERVGDEPPNLPTQNGCTVENQKGIQQGILRKLRHQIHQYTAEGNVQHQIRNAFIAVLKTETVKTPAQVFQ